MVGLGLSLRMAEVELRARALLSHRAGMPLREMETGRRAQAGHKYSDHWTQRTEIEAESELFPSLSLQQL